ncbi:MAG: hypothetical protein ACSHWZ_16605 [Sulfitobacter sp.]
MNIRNMAATFDCIDEQTTKKLMIEAACSQLEEAAQAVEHVAFDLAGEVPSHRIEALILIAAQLEKQAKEVIAYRQAYRAA